MKYRNIGSHHFGFADISISELAEHFSDFFVDLSALVTVTDSSPNVALLQSWKRTVAESNGCLVPVGASVWIPSNWIRRLLEEGKTFHGFDEIYLMKHRPSEEITLEGRFTTDGVTFDEDVPSSFLRTFWGLGAVRYVSDGCGLNFACESEALLQKLREVEYKIRISGS